MSIMSFVKFKDDSGKDRDGKDKESESITTNGPTSTQSGVPVGAQGKMEAFLGRGSKVVGALSFSGPVELDGFVEGEINAQDRLTIGESAVINAKVTGAEILVKGTVNGDITATKRLSLRKPAKVVGNISCTNLSIEEGVVFEGKSTMSNLAKVVETKPSPVKTILSEKVGASL